MNNTTDLLYTISKRAVNNLDSDSIMVLFFILDKVFEQSSGNYALMPMSEIEKATNKTRQRVRTIVRQLVELNIITIESTSKSTKITITDTDSYKLYQQTNR